MRSTSRGASNSRRTTDSSMTAPMTALAATASTSDSQ
jgi:hypothetical protein